VKNERKCDLTPLCDMACTGLLYLLDPLSECKAITVRPSVCPDGTT